MEQLDVRTESFANAFTKGTRAGYEQSHTSNFMLLPEMLATDQAALSENYMRAIFGGAAPDNEIPHHAYRESIKAFESEQFASQPFTSVSDTDLGGDTKASLLDMFAAEHQKHNNGVNGEIQMMLNGRGNTRDLTLVTYYGKNQNRYHNHVGQDVNELYPPNMEGYRGTTNLSSRTSAGNDAGGRVPLYADQEESTAPAISGALPYFPNDAVADKGNYYGSDTANYVQYYESDSKTDLAKLFGKGEAVPAQPAATMPAFPHVAFSNYGTSTAYHAKKILV